MPTLPLPPPLTAVSGYGGGGSPELPPLWYCRLSACICWLSCCWACGPFCGTIGERCDAPAGLWPRCAWPMPLDTGEVPRAGLGEAPDCCCCCCCCGGGRATGRWEPGDGAAGEMRLNSCCRLIGNWAAEAALAAAAAAAADDADEEEPEAEAFEGGGSGGGGVEEQRGSGSGGGTSLSEDGHGDGEYWPAEARPLGVYGTCECGLSDRELPAPESRAGLPRWYWWEEGISRSMLGLRMSLGPRAGGWG